jgi:hypothetical protein
LAIEPREEGQAIDGSVSYGREQKNLKYEPRRREPKPKIESVEYIALFAVRGEGQGPC